jgi:segregation and condensation protein B
VSRKKPRSPAPSDGTATTMPVSESDTILPADGTATTPAPPVLPRDEDEVGAGDSSAPSLSVEGTFSIEDPLPVEGSEAAPQVEPARELTLTHLRGLLESLIFASDKPLKSGELARLASAPLKQVRDLLTELKSTYTSRGIVLDEVAGGWLFRTNAQYAPFVRELASERPVRLTRAQVETLAIAAYRQPITRPEIDDIRGVDSGATLKLLLERDLVRILGKKDEPGRPLLYGTTTAFLELFGLKSLKDLPTLKEFTELNEDSRRVADAAESDAAPEEAVRAREPSHDTVASPAPTTPNEWEDTPSSG